MKVLVACEYSGRVRDAFTARGHDAISCDLLPSDSPGKHYQGNVLDIINEGFDLMVAHPPCTYLSVSGMHWTTRGLRDPQLTEDALDFVMVLMGSTIPKICIENPISVISSRIRQPDQIIHPWMFGHDASKKTCLWLKNLPKLVPDRNKVVPPAGWGKVREAHECIDTSGGPWCPEHDKYYSECDCIGSKEEGVILKANSGVMFGTREYPAPKQLWANQTPTGQNKLGPSADRWKIRSTTYEGIANAMALQWGLK